MAEKSEPTDLLGDPLRPLPDRRGRRKLRFPVEVYEKVELLAADRLTQEEISDAIGISVPSLTKYFSKELAGAASRQRAELLSRLDAQSRNGNTSATKALLAELDRQQAASAFSRRERRAQPASPAPGHMGKKAVARAVADAEIAAGDKFAPRGALRLAVDNAAPDVRED